MDIKRPKNITDAQWEQAKNLYNTAKEKGDRYPELTVAQAALETGWFKHPSGKFNYFGQKATKSQKGTVLNTKEASNNIYYKTQSKFRDYESIEEAVDDRLKKWGSKYKDAKNVEEAIGKIWRYDEKTGQGKGYATDINYGNKIKSILNTLGFDTKTSIQPQTKPLEYKNVVDIQAPSETQGIIFSGQDEEPIVEEKESIKASQRLNEKSFLEELQQRYIIPETIQPVQYSQTDIQPTVIKPIEYNPIQTFQNGGEQIGNLTPEQQKNIEAQRQWLNSWNKNRVVQGQKVNSGIEIPFSTDIYIDELNVNRPSNKKTLGEYDTVSNRLLFDVDYTEKSGIPSHEFSHRFQNDLLKQNPEQYSKFIANPINKYLKKTGNFTPYQLDPQETHSEINRLRYNEGYKPDQIIKTEDLDKLNLNDYNLNQFNKDEILDILNSTVSNLKKEEIFYAQNGGGIPISSNGVYDYPNQKVIVPTNGRITMKNVDYPILGRSLQTGEEILMQPGKEYFFKNTQQVLEIPYEKTKAK